MTYYGEGPMTLVVKNKACGDYASIAFCVRQKKEDIAWNFTKTPQKTPQKCTFI